MRRPRARRPASQAPRLRAGCFERPGVEPEPELEPELEQVPGGASEGPAPSGSGNTRSPNPRVRRARRGGAARRLAPHPPDAQWIAQARRRAGFRAPTNMGRQRQSATPQCPFEQRRAPSEPREPHSLRRAGRRWLGRPTPGCSWEPGHSARPRGRRPGRPGCRRLSSEGPAARPASPWTSLCGFGARQCAG